MNGYQAWCQRNIHITKEFEIKNAADRSMVRSTENSDHLLGAQLEFQLDGVTQPARSSLPFKVLERGLTISM